MKYEIILSCLLLFKREEYAGLQVGMAEISGSKIEKTDSKMDTGYKYPDVIKAPVCKGFSQKCIPPFSRGESFKKSLYDQINCGSINFGIQLSSYEINPIIYLSPFRPSHIQIPLELIWRSPGRLLLRVRFWASVWLFESKDCSGQTPSPPVPFV